MIQVRFKKLLETYQYGRCFYVRFNGLKISARRSHIHTYMKRFAILNAVRLVGARVIFKAIIDILWETSGNKSFLRSPTIEGAAVRYQCNDEVRGAGLTARNEGPAHDVSVLITPYNTRVYMYVL